jgi:hypothetical protein
MAARRSVPRHRRAAGEQTNEAPLSQAAIPRQSARNRYRRVRASIVPDIERLVGPMSEFPFSYTGVVAAKRRRFGKRLVRIVLGAAWAGLTLPVPFENGPNSLPPVGSWGFGARGWRLHFFPPTNSYLTTMLVVRADGFVDPRRHPHVRESIRGLKISGPGSAPKRRLSELLLIDT